MRQHPALPRKPVLNERTLGILIFCLVDAINLLPYKLKQLSPKIDKAR